MVISGDVHLSMQYMRIHSATIILTNVKLQSVPVLRNVHPMYNGYYPSIT